MAIIVKDYIDSIKDILNNDAVKKLVISIRTDRDVAKIKDTPVKAPIEEEDSIDDADEFWGPFKTQKRWIPPPERKAAIDASMLQALLEKRIKNNDKNEGSF